MVAMLVDQGLDVIEPQENSPDGPLEAAAESGSMEVRHLPHSIKVARIDRNAGGHSTPLVAAVVADDLALVQLAHRTRGAAGCDLRSPAAERTWSGLGVWAQ